MNYLARLHKAEMWAKVAEEMSVPWTEAEMNHWRLGKSEIAKRNRDKSYSMDCVDPPQLRVDDAKVLSQKQQQDQQQQQRFGEWSAKEESLLFTYKRAGMSWQEIAGYLPERTTDSCKIYYYRILRRCDGWSPELQNKLCRIYERLKPEMWAKIGQELSILWGCAEEMHWHLRAGVTAERAAISPIVQPAANLRFLAPSRVPGADTHQNRYQEYDRIQQPPRHNTHPLSQAGPFLTASEQRFRSSVALPSFASFTASIELSFRPPPRGT
ncbi:hypothetical protein E4U39_006414 [Claviceps sp. Clav50 group G5]|nr:hypothetical protein E4U39_006414 [Claviceps sp. Clav50 group G5]